MYILILTIVLTAANHRGVAADSSVTVVDNFQSQEACLTAGNAWLRQVRTNQSNVIRERTSALCVLKK